MIRHSSDLTSSRQQDSRRLRQRRLTFERLESRELLSAVRPTPPLFQQPTAHATVPTTVAPVSSTPAPAPTTSTQSTAPTASTQSTAPTTSTQSTSRTTSTQAAAATTSAHAAVVPTPPVGSTRTGLSRIPPAPAPPPAPAAPSATQLYIQNFNPAYYIQKGTNFTNFAFTPAGAAQRLGIPVSEIQTGIDYDFAELTAVTNQLAGVNRLQALQAIFAKITAGATTDEAKQLAVLLFLQEVSVHNGLLEPVYPNGMLVTDPLVLLQLGEMDCGQVDRIAADLFSSVGYQTRLDQLGGHVIGEISYGGNWHYFDADLFGGGQCVFLPNGSIPSVNQLDQQPYLIDSLAGLLGAELLQHRACVRHALSVMVLFLRSGLGRAVSRGQSAGAVRHLQDGHARPSGELHLLRLGGLCKRAGPGSAAL